MLKKVFFLVLCICAVTVCTVCAEGETDITQTGLDLLTSSPAQETVYTAGEGSVTYTPGSNGQPSTLIFENATINGVKPRVKYWSNKKTASLLVKGDVDIVLKGNSEIDVSKTDESAGASGLFVFDGNVTIKGDGTLTVDNSKVDTKNYAPGSPVSIIGNYDDFYGTTTGKLTIESGNVNINTVNGKNVVCLALHNDFNMSGGNLIINGGTSSIRSVIGDTNISGGRVECNNSTKFGIYNYDGDIKLSNGALVEINEEGSNYFGLQTGRTSYETGERHTKGDIIVDGATVNITSSSIGMYTVNGGSINILSGELNIHNSDYGIFSSGDMNMSGGNITIMANDTLGKQDGTVGAYCVSGVISGGKIDISVENGSDEEGLPIGAFMYDEGLQINNGEVILKSQSSTGKVNYGFFNGAGICVDVNGGLVTVQSNGQAFDISPDISDYPRNTITSATDFDGNMVEEYKPEYIENYKYFNIVPKGFSVKFEDGTAIISAGEEVENVMVIFAEYDLNDRLISYDLKETNLKIGTNNTVKPDKFAPKEEHVKIMVWNSMNDMVPLTDAWVK